MISTTIGQINEIATANATAVEQQGTAMQEIAHNGTTEVSANIGSVTQTIGETGAAADEFLGAAGELSKQAEVLRGQVAGFLAQVRAA